MSKKRVLSGMRPTGTMHLGNLEGALRNWVKLQDKGEYECLYFVADWHALTTDFEDTSMIEDNTIEMVIDWLSAGLDPNKSIIFRQSLVKEVSELHLLLSMITPVGWLERNPTYKEMIKELHLKPEQKVYGFLGYPVLQAADILVYKGNVVPVGEDQLSHLNLSKDIAERFNYLYGNIFELPEPKLTQSARIPGIDGKKMSKSCNNHIPISASEDEIYKNVESMFTDPTRAKATDVGHPEGCVVYALHEVYNLENAMQIRNDCVNGRVGCVDCKKDLAKHLCIALEPIRAKRKELDTNPQWIKEILEEGSNKARRLAQETLKEVRKAMKML